MQWEQTITIGMTHAEAAETTLGPGGPGSFWAEVIQRLVNEGADIEFFYDQKKQQMDFQLRNCDRLIYDWDEHAQYLTFTWQRTVGQTPLAADLQGLHNGDRLCDIDFITDGAMERARKRLHKRLQREKIIPDLVVYDDIINDPETHMFRDFFPQRPRPPIPRPPKVINPKKSR